MQPSKDRRYSITSSAIASTPGGFEMDRRRGPEIDDELEFCRSQHRQIGRLLALENPAGIDTGLTVHVGNAASITQQPTSGGELTPLVDRGQGVADGQCGEPLDPTVEESIGADHETGRLQLGRGCEHRKAWEVLGGVFRLTRITRARVSVDNE
jgi:hypothetical protein